MPSVCGDRRANDAARSFSAAAWMARPVRDQRNQPASARAEHDDDADEPQAIDGDVGAADLDGAGRQHGVAAAGPRCRTSGPAPACSVSMMPTAATTLASTGAVRSGLETATWTSAPRAAATSERDDDLHPGRHVHVVGRQPRDGKRELAGLEVAEDVQRHGRHGGGGEVDDARALVREDDPHRQRRRRRHRRSDRGRRTGCTGSCGPHSFVQLGACSGGAIAQTSTTPRSAPRFPAADHVSSGGALHSSRWHGCSVAGGVASGTMLAAVRAALGVRLLKGDSMRNSRALLALGAASALIVAACGGDNSGSGSATTTAAAATTAASSAATTAAAGGATTTAAAGGATTQRRRRRRRTPASRRSSSGSTTSRAVSSRCPRSARPSCPA